MVVGQDIELDRNLKFEVSGEDTMKTICLIFVVFGEEEFEWP